MMYLLVLPFHRVLTLPWFGEKLQPPEVAFLGLAAVAVATAWRRPVRWRVSVADAGVAAWLGANTLALVWSPGPITHEGIIETLGIAYLAALYAAVRITATPELLGRYGQWFGSAAAAAALLGLAGSTAASMGAQTRLATLAITPVPYIGHAARAQALTTGPQMLASILLLAIPLFIAARLHRGWRRVDTFVVAILAAGLLATVSKTALCLIPALCVMWSLGPSSTGVEVSRRQRRRRRSIAWSSAIVTAAVLVGASHVVVMRTGEITAMTASQLVAGAPLDRFSWSGDAWAVMPTTYYFNRQASILAIERFWPRGVGPAAQPRFAEQLKVEGQYPSSIRLTTPHSVYLGTVAELGAPGLIALALLLSASVFLVRRLAGEHPRSWEAAAYAGAGVAFLIEALATDTMNCRHYWFLLAVIASRVAVQEGLDRTDDRGQLAKP